MYVLLSYPLKSVCDEDDGRSRSQNLSACIALARHGDVYTLLEKFARFHYTVPIYNCGRGELVNIKVSFR
jgi:hypothetical protein